MARVTLDVEIPDGLHLGLSQEIDGAFSALLFGDDEKGILGHAALFPHLGDHDDRGDDGAQPSPATESPDSGGGRDQQLSAQQLAALIGALVALATLVVVVRPVVAPHVSGWWNGKVLPAFQSVRRRAARAVRTVAERIPWSGRVSATDSEGSIEYRGSVSDARLETALQDFRADPTSQKVRKKAVEAIVGRAFTGDRMEALQSLEMEGYGDFLAAGASRGLLTPEKVGVTLDQLLAKNPSLVEAEPLAQIGQMLGGVQASGQLTPLRVGRAIER